MHVFTDSALMDHSSVSNVMPISFQNFPLYSRLHCNMLYGRASPPPNFRRQFQKSCLFSVYWAVQLF